MRPAVLLLVAVVCAVHTRAAPNNSSNYTNCVSPDGTYDLTPIAGVDLPGSDASYTYLLHVCGVATETDCATYGGSFCQYSGGNPPWYQHVMAKWDTTGTWTACPTTTCPNGGVQIYFANGDKCAGSGPPRAVTFIFNCPVQGQPSSTSYVLGTQGCIYTVTMTHAVGCGRQPNPHNCKSPNGAYDLTPIAGVDLPAQDASYSYFLHVCGFANESVCASHGGAFCQYTDTLPSTYLHSLAKWDASGLWSACTDPTACPNGGVTIWYQNGDPCNGNGPARDVTLVFACPAQGQPSSTAYKVLSPAQCQYVVQMTHSVGCGSNSTAVVADEQW